MNIFYKINNYVLFFLFLFTISIYADIDKKSTFYIHVVNEKFNGENPNLREFVDRFLKEVWEEAVLKEVNDIQEINKIAYKKLNTKCGAAKTLYENGLRFANSTYTPTSIHDETLSSITRLRGDSADDWSGQGHPLIIVFSNYALHMGDLINVGFGYDQSQGNVLNFGVSLEELNGINPQDIFYEWTSSFAEDKIIGTEKEEYSQGHGWRMAVIVNDTIVTVPSLKTPLRDCASISGRFTQGEIRRLAVDLDKSLSDKFPHAEHESSKNEQKEMGIAVMGDSEEYFNNLRLKHEQVFSHEIEKVKVQLKDCKDPEIRIFFEEMITLMHVTWDPSCEVVDEKSKMQAVLFRWQELYRRYHNKFDFNFQKALITAANMLEYTLGMYELQDLAFHKEVVQWAVDLVEKFPKESSSYALLGFIKIMNDSKNNEVFQILEKGLALDPNNQECLNVMKLINKSR